MNRIFVRIRYDTNDIKTSSIWGISLVCDDKVLYIETQKSHLSESLPKETFEKLTDESYFMILNEANANVKMAIDNDEEINVNIFKNTDEKIIEKILTFIKDNSKDKNTIIFFRNSYEEVMFFDFLKINFVDEFNKILSQNISCLFEKYTVYDELVNEYIKLAMEKFKEENASEEEISMFLKLKLVIEVFIMQDFYIKHIIEEY